MPRQSVFDMKVSKVYPLLVAKAERKGRTKEEVDEIILWLTGYDMSSVDQEQSASRSDQRGRLRGKGREH